MSYSFSVWFALAFPRLHKTFITDTGRPYTDTSCLILPGTLKSSQPIGDDPNLCMALSLTYNFVRYDEYDDNTQCPSWHLWFLDLFLYVLFFFSDGQWPSNHRGFMEVPLIPLPFAPSAPRVPNSKEKCVLVITRGYTIVKSLCNHYIITISTMIMIMIMIMITIVKSLLTTI